MPTIKIKYYTIRINEHAINDKHGLWYRQKVGQEFKTVLAIAENGNNTKAPVFKCVTAPFWHVYPNHCTIVKEETIEA
jgi:hypothetical protein